VGKPSLNAAQPYAKAEGRVFLLVPAYPGCPGTKAVKRLLLLLLYGCTQNSIEQLFIIIYFAEQEDVHMINTRTRAGQERHRKLALTFCP